MDVKIDTKEKFTVITPITSILTANMTEKLSELLLSHQKEINPNMILDLHEVKIMDAEIALIIAEIQQSFYNNDFSFVVCSLNENIKKVFVNEELLDFLNYTPTESEAWDILQMEEIERELMKGDE